MDHVVTCTGPLRQASPLEEDDEARYEFFEMIDDYDIDDCVTIDGEFPSGSLGENTLGRTTQTPFHTECLNNSKYIQQLKEEHKQIDEAIKNILSSAPKLIRK